MDSNDVSAVTKLLLAREPQSESAVITQIENMRSIPILVVTILESEEFESPKCRKRLRNITLTPELINQVFLLILGRKPSGNAVQNYISNTKNLFQFIQSLTNTQEYRKRTHRMLDIEGLAASEAFNSNPKTIYLHIPKTAGKSFSRLALSNYGPHCCLSTSGKLEWSQWQRAKMVGGHFQYSAFNPMTSKRLFLAVVRNPVDRAISRFNFYKNRRGAQKKKIEQGFDHFDMKATIRNSRFRKEFVDNYQCRYLSSGKNFKAVERAFRHDAFIVGHFENIESWIELVGQRLGWTQSKLPEVNVAAEQDYSVEYRQDEELISMLTKRNTEDSRLFEFIKRAGVYESMGGGFDYMPFRLES